jgi:hypothetical protein
MGYRPAVRQKIEQVRRSRMEVGRVILVRVGEPSQHIVQERKPGPRPAASGCSATQRTRLDGQLAKLNNPKHRWLGR